jgi:hypothetical protein
VCEAGIRGQEAGECATGNIRNRTDRTHGPHVGRYDFDELFLDVETLFPLFDLLPALPVVR